MPNRETKYQPFGAAFLLPGTPSKSSRAVSNFLRATQGPEKALAKARLRIQGRNGVVWRRQQRDLIAIENDISDHER